MVDMVNEKELERIDQAIEYFQRYDSIKRKVKTNKENREYLKTYIHDQDFVEKEFDYKNKVLKVAGISVGAAVLAFLLFWAILGIEFVWVAIIIGAVIGVGLAIAGISVQKFRLTEAIRKQLDVNDGIHEQIILLKERDVTVLEQKDTFYKGLENRVDFMSLDYMKNIDAIKAFLMSGEALTCEEAVDCFESSMLLAEISTLTMNQDEEIRKPSFAEDRERFGDPLELIKKKKKIRRKKAVQN